MTVTYNEKGKEYFKKLKTLLIKRALVIVYFLFVLLVVFINTGIILMSIIFSIFLFIYLCISTLFPIYKQLRWSSFIINEISINDGYCFYTNKVFAFKQHKVVVGNNFIDRNSMKLDQSLGEVYEINYRGDVYLFPIDFFEANILNQIGLLK